VVGWLAGLAPGVGAHVAVSFGWWWSGGWRV
jgi:hypothetical protein